MPAAEKHSTHHRPSAWIDALRVLAVLSGVVLVVRWVDLTPRVEPEFFFSEDDPQLQASEEIGRRYGASPQILIRVAGADIRAPAYREVISDLTQDLRGVTGVTGVTSAATVDAYDSPLWSRLLVSPDERATLVLVDVVAEWDGDLVTAVERRAEDTERAGYMVALSGVPFVIERIRQRLFRDLVVFSTAAFVLFGVMVGLIYRRWRIVAGTLGSCLAAAAATLALNQALGVSIGLLTANIATIVFVLTLSHIVFLTANWRAATFEPGADEDRLHVAIRVTIPGSFWAMVTTLLGFLSLFVASARPLRELGMAGAIGTITALLTAYTLYPSFLRGVRPPASPQPQRRFPLPTQHPRRWLIGVAAGAALFLVGLTRVSTDPNLLNYFGRGTEIREGLVGIDRDGGSSPLSLVVRDSAGERLDTDDAVDRMRRMQSALDADPAVGTALSLAAVLDEISRIPFVELLTWRAILDLPLLNRPAAGFVSADRTEGHVFLRMREGNRREERGVVIARVGRTVQQHGFEPVLIGGLYDLQQQLGSLIATSLRIGLGGLLVLFGVIGWIISRSGRTTVTLVGALAVIPAVVLGGFGYAGAAVDIISSPAANVALAIGVDSMIHLTIRARSLARDGLTHPQAWLAARAQLAHPIAAATGVIAVGFGIFSLSTFPPTQRFGWAVILGTVTAAAMALIVLPLGAALLTTKDHR